MNLSSEVQALVLITLLAVRIIAYSLSLFNYQSTMQACMPWPLEALAFGSKDDLHFKRKPSLVAFNRSYG